MYDKDNVIRHANLLNSIFLEMIYMSKYHRWLGFIGSVYSFFAWYENAVRLQKDMNWSPSINRQLA